MMAGGESDIAKPDCIEQNSDISYQQQLHLDQPAAEALFSNDEMKVDTEMTASASDLQGAVDTSIMDVTMKNGDRRQSESSSSLVAEEDCEANESRLADRKIFVGGLCWETTEADLREYFSQFGRIQSCQIKYDGASQQPRGFGFVVFEDAESVTRVLANRDQHHVCGKRVDPKPAKPSKDVSRKVFVGGLSPHTSFEQIHDYFSQFGKVESLDLPFDSTKCSRKNYVFVAYATKQEALAAARSEKQSICGRTCDVRIALPRDEILKMRSRGVTQVPIKFAAPQSVQSPTYGRSRLGTYSGPIPLARTQAAEFATRRQSLSSSQGNPYPLASSRFRAPYRSGPAASESANSFGRSVVAPCGFTAPFMQPQAQPQPPFHVTLQCGSTGQLAAPYQLCMLEQPAVPQMAYAPYFATAPAAPSLLAAPPSLLTAAPFPSMMLGGTSQQRDLFCACQPYTYTTDGYVALAANGMQMGLAAAPVAPGGVVYAPIEQPAVQPSVDSGVEVVEEQKAAERTNERHVG